VKARYKPVLLPFLSMSLLIDLERLWPN